MAPLAAAPQGAMARRVSKLNNAHLTAFEEFLGDERFSVFQLEEIHDLLLAEVHRRCGPQAAVHLVGKALLNFQLSGEDAADAATPTRGSTTGGHTSRAESLVQLSELEATEESEEAPVVSKSLASLAAGIHASESIEGMDELDPRRHARCISQRADFWKPQSIWKRAAAAAVAPHMDPWVDRGVHLLAMSLGVRERWKFNEASGQWETFKDEVLVKMEEKPFGAGAMRECYAMKKLSTFAPHRNWEEAQNMVAKLYKKPVDKQTYYDDVLLQMDSKRLADAFNLMDPPKKVDFLQTCLLHVPEHPGSPTYCLEHLIEGDYIKYNNNCGFVEGADAEDERVRDTPQAFSHFTFEFTKGQKIVVDIQGVGDLYTDPQIHSVGKVGYGGGNLGMRGIAFFFRTHECNGLCRKLGLTPFPRNESDYKLVGASPSSSLQHTNSDTLASSDSDLARVPTMQRVRELSADGSSGASLSERDQSNMATPQTVNDWLHLFEDVPMYPQIDAEVHWDVAKLSCEVVLIPDLHPNEDPEAARKSARFHLRFAASHGHRMALLACAKWHNGCGLSLASTHFSGLRDAYKKAGEHKEFLEVGLRCLVLAAERGVRGAAAAAAHAYATASGVGAALGGADLTQAVRWYKKALDGDLGTEEEETEVEDFPGASLPAYEVQAALGKLYMDGGEGLEANPTLAAEWFNEAAEAATEGMKAKLANKYFELAAVAEGMCDDE